MAIQNEAKQCRQHEDIVNRIFEKIDEVSEGIGRIELAAVRNIADLDKRLALVEVKMGEILSSIRESNAPKSARIDWPMIAKLVGLAVAAAVAGAGGGQLVQ